LIEARKFTNKEKNLEKEKIKQKNLKDKDSYESNNLGDYQNLYPIPRGVSKKDD
jgi:hypothetical protein